jgi:hypothetical protein
MKFRLCVLFPPSFILLLFLKHVAYSFYPFSFLFFLVLIFFPLSNFSGFVCLSIISSSSERVFDCSVVV